MGKASGVFAARHVRGRVRGVSGDRGFAGEETGFRESFRCRKRQGNDMGRLIQCFPRDQKEWLVTAVEQAGDSIVITDRRWTILYVNPAFERLSGFSREEVLGSTMDILRSPLHGDDFYREIHRRLEGGGRWSGRFTSRRKDGSLREVESTISPVRDGSGAVVKFVSVSRDVTREMEMEKRLRQAEKFEAIGTLTGGIAHDFNNILAIITGYAELSLHDLPQGSGLRENLLEVTTAVRRARDLIRQLLSFTRPDDTSPGVISPAPVAKECLKLLRGALPSTITFRTDIAAETEKILGNATQIHQILMNLCANAAHAMRDRGGTLDVSLKSAAMETNLETVGGELPAGTYVLLTVGDTGHGMDDGTLRRIFDPYFTTKPKGEGTGMGLSVVHGIVRSLGGGMQVESEPARGSTFKVYLPCVKGGRDDFLLAPMQGLLPGEGSILFVDDEPALGASAKALLERLGYRVTCAASPVEALQRFREAPRDFDLVITDQTMPEMTGAVLAGKILALRPDVPVVLCTGYSEFIGEGEAKSLGIREFLVKPVDLQRLAAVVRRALSC